MLVPCAGGMVYLHLIYSLLLRATLRKSVKHQNPLRRFRGPQILRCWESILCRRVCSSRFFECVRWSAACPFFSLVSLCPQRGSTSNPEFLFDEKTKRRDTKDSQLELTQTQVHHSFSHCTFRPDFVFGNFPEIFRLVTDQTWPFTQKSSTGQVVIFGPERREQFVKVCTLETVDLCPQFRDYCLSIYLLSL